MIIITLLYTNVTQLHDCRKHVIFRSLLLLVQNFALCSAVFEIPHHEPPIM